MDGFKEAVSLEEIEQFTKTHPFSFLYLYKDNCSVCHAVQPQAAEVLKDFPQIQTMQANVSQLPLLAGKYTIFTVPVLLLFVDGKEVLRKARFVEMAEFKHQLARITEAYEA